jgi:hypothetical protein
MKTLIAVAASLVTMVCVVTSSASAAPLGNVEELRADGATTSALQPVHWRRYRHCHWRHGYRRCHGGYGRRYGYGYAPGLYLNFGRGHRHHHHHHHRRGGRRH